MKFVIFRENNKKENESFIFFLQYDNNEEMIHKLEEIINSTDFSYMDGDYSSFEINTSNKLSEQTVNELTSIKIGSFYSMFTACRGKFNFNYGDFEVLTDTEKASKLDELFYACRIVNFFKQDTTETNEVVKLDFKRILESWDNNESTNDIYHLILSWINNYDHTFCKELKEITSEIKYRMVINEETNDIVEDFVYGKYSQKLRSRLIN